MRQFLKDHNAWLWVAAIVAGFVGSLLPPAITGSPNALPISVLIFLLNLAVAWWRWKVRQDELRVEQNRQAILASQRRQEELRQQFVLFKPAADLIPQDLGFQPLHPDQEL